ncbi:MAG: transposase [Methylobacter sp.]
MEGYLVSDHVHILISIPPKYPASQAVVFIKGKSAIAIVCNYMGEGKTSQDKVSGRGAITFQR